MRRALVKEMELYNQMLREAVQSDKDTLGIITSFLLEPAGKQMRPTLTLLTAALHGEINKKSYAAAILFEILHWATLIHDDIIDEAYVRRGELTLGALMRSKSAVLVGDYLLSRGLGVAAKAENFQVIVSSTDTIEGIVEGELLQSEFARKLTTTEKDYLEIIRLKTASLLGAVAESGAASVGATKEQQNDMYRFGELIGYAFQIQDDLLDIESSTSGKAKYNDFRERKVTLPLLHAMEIGGRKDAIYHVRRAATSQKSIEWLLEFIRRNDGVEYSRQVMNEKHAEAIAIIQKYPASKVQESLIAYCDFVVGRNK